MKIGIGNLLRITVIVAALILSACGGGGSVSPTATLGYTIGGTVSGLTGTVVLQDNGGDNLTVTPGGNASFTFATSVRNGSPYAVSVFTQPTGQTCTVSTGAGTVSGYNVSNVSVTCSANAYTVGGSVSGLSGSIVLQDNGGDTISVISSGNPSANFNFPAAVAYGSLYAVTILTQPTGQNCSIANGTGTMGSGNISNVGITCATNTYTVGGTVSGLNGSVILQNNGADNYSISVNNPFTFPTTVAYGNPYLVSILTQPSGQTCSVNNPGGTTTSNVSNVAVSCATIGWTWVSGSNGVNQAGTYGTKGQAAAGNVPGARQNEVSWTDSSGKLWLFGGWGYDSAGTWGYLNDLWQFDGTQWIWMSGSNVGGQAGTYGTQGVAAAGNVPGARLGAVIWTDSSGKLWLFGGIGYDSAGTFSYLNDLWQFDGTQWTWVSGSNVVNQPGVYGTQGVAAAGNVPSARSGAVSWTDSSGKLWLFGGWGRDSAGTWGHLNDLWQFDGTQWIWMSGSNVGGQAGTYGTQGAAAAGNVPGARSDAVIWTDSSGKLWLFGGGGIDSAGTAGYLNDLWQFDGTQWTWVSGSNGGNQTGVYGTQGQAAAGNVPGARWGAVSWTDSSGKLWLFGGFGVDSARTPGYLNDLWQFDGTQWIWMSGSNVGGQAGTYGTQGAAAAGNVPGARSTAVSWTDSSGKLWLFGGAGLDSAGTGGYLNDLWRYQP